MSYEIKDINGGAVKSPLDGTERVEIQEAVGGLLSSKQTTTQDIANLGGAGTGTVESVTGDGVDNTDPDNPVITILDSATPSTAGATITLDMESKIQRIFVGSASFATPKTIAMSNTTGSLVFNFFINVTDVAAILTVPADWFMSDLNFDGTDWTPPETGRYELGGSFDGTNWWVKIQGPFA